MPRGLKYPSIFTSAEIIFVNIASESARSCNIKLSSVSNWLDSISISAFRLLASEDSAGRLCAKPLKLDEVFGICSAS